MKSLKQYEKDLDELKLNLAVDLNNIDVCLSRQPGLFEQAATAYGGLMAATDAAKSQLDEVDAVQDGLVRKKALEKGEKTTEAAVANAVLLSPAHKAAVDALQATKAMLLLSGALKDAFVQRMACLEALAGLQQAKQDYRLCHFNNRRPIMVTYMACCENFDEAQETALVFHMNNKWFLATHDPQVVIEFCPWCGRRLSSLDPIPVEGSWQWAEQQARAGKAVQGPSVLCYFSWIPAETKFGRYSLPADEFNSYYDSLGYHSTGHWHVYIPPPKKGTWAWAQLELAKNDQQGQPQMLSCTAASGIADFVMRRNGKGGYEWTRADFDYLVDRWWDLAEEEIDKHSTMTDWHIVPPRGGFIVECLKSNSVTPKDPIGRWERSLEVPGVYSSQTAAEGDVDAALKKGHTFPCRRVTHDPNAIVNK